MLREVTLARAQGLFDLLGGLWPARLAQKSELVYGPKADGRLQKTSGALLASAGISMLPAGADPEGMLHARRTGIGTAMTFLAIGLIYVPRRRIPATYLLDAAKETAWLMAWWRGGSCQAGKRGAPEQRGCRNPQRPAGPGPSSPVMFFAVLQWGRWPPGPV
ncbi:hypothetical protein ACSHWO_34705 [Streptomyces sp. HUAS TT3]|uniref:hypothetical protein n=1 Tax=Streptomyces sp. HUAS TT3 TaxID=3447510 RepID=UPI003F65C4A3